jgi:hypothetical protein
MRIAIRVENLHKLSVLRLLYNLRETRLGFSFFCARVASSRSSPSSRRRIAFAYQTVHEFFLSFKESVLKFLIFRACYRSVIVVSAASLNDFFINFVAAARSGGIFAFFQRRCDRNAIADKIMAIPLKSELP